MTLYQITTLELLSDEISEDLMDLGVVITASKESSVLYFSDENLDDVKNILEDLKYSLEEIADENWVQKSQEVWQKVKFGSFHVSPVTEKKEREEHELLIIPGTGFGTGQHATTFMMLDEISNLETIPETILDFGTGSGLLAIAAADKFNQKVIATDNDPLAIENAKDNVKINDKEALVELSLDPLENINGKFELILANIYAEVLCFFSQDLINKLTDNGILLLSGILPEKSQLVEEHFSSLKLVKKRVQDNWVLLYFKKRI